MRLFVALDPPAEAMAHLERAVALLRAPGPPGSPAADLPGLRWVPPERRHLTVAFLGEVDEPRLADLRSRLARAAGRHPPLRLHLHGGGRFGDRVLFVKLAGDLAALGRLADSCAAAARHSGITLDERPFRAHLTLARSRGPTRLAGLAEALASYDGPWWPAEHVDLVRSHLGPRPSYEVLDRWTLGGPG